MTVIKLTKGARAIVDPEDYNRLSQYKWYLSSSGYAVRTVYKDDGIRWMGKMPMHREIMGNPPYGVYVDHINHNRLDNRRSNLRLCTPQENSLNRSLNRNNTLGFRGVYRDHRKIKRPYFAQIVRDGKKKTIGSFTTPEEAYAAYLDAATAWFNSKQAA